MAVHSIGRTDSRMRLIAQDLRWLDKARPRDGHQAVLGKAERSAAALTEAALGWVLKAAIAAVIAVTGLVVTAAVANWAFRVFSTFTA